MVHPFLHLRNGSLGMRLLLRLDVLSFRLAAFAHGEELHGRPGSAVSQTQW